MVEFYSSLSLLLKTLGYDFLEERTLDLNAKEIDRTIQTGVIDSITYKLESNNALAYMKIVDNDYVVLKGSTIVKKQGKYIPVGVLDARETLIARKQLINDDNPNLLKLTVDYSWKSPSSASAFVVGREDNGRTSWKHEGRTLAEIQILEE